MYNPTKPYKKQILSLIEKTWNTPYVFVEQGTYPVIKKKFSQLEVDHTDGVGTKGIYHWQAKTFKNAVLDALAMNLNDLAMARAVPYKLQNHLILPKDNHLVILEIVNFLVSECKKRSIAVTGGETSIQNNTTGLDLSISMSGFVKKTTPNFFKAGDLVIGLKSNGLHSNGFTKVRQVFGNKTRREFTTPTRIYSDEILNLINKIPIHGMMHITGGAFAKLKDLIKEVDVEIDRDHNLKPQPIFKLLYQKGISDLEMYTTFNCGIGFVLSIHPKYRQKAQKLLSHSDIIGKVKKGKGQIKINSMFSDKQLTL